MRVKFARWAAAGLVMFTVTCAFAQPMCTVVDVLSKAAQSNFEVITGPDIERQADDPGGRTECCYAKLNLPGANFCTVKPSIAWETGARYSCQWLFERGGQADAAEAFRRLSEQVKTCLSPQVWQNESTAPGLRYRASLDGARLGEIDFYLDPGRRASSRPSIVLTFETHPMSSPRRRR